MSLILKIDQYLTEMCASQCWVPYFKIYILTLSCLAFEKGVQIKKIFFVKYLKSLKKQWFDLFPDTIGVILDIDDYWNTSFAFDKIGGHCRQCASPPGFAMKNFTMILILIRDQWKSKSRE